MRGSTCFFTMKCCAGRADETVLLEDKGVLAARTFKMQITHVQALFSPEHGGPLYSLSNWSLGQTRLGHEVSLYVLEGFPHASPAVRLPSPVRMNVCRVDPPAKLGRSSELSRLLRTAPAADVYHLHGVWMRAMHYGAVAARRHRRPYVVELAGAYEPYPLSQKWLRKWIARRWFQDDLLHRAACLHVASAQEARGLRALGFKAPIAVTAVGVDMDAITGAQRDNEQAVPPWPELANRPFLLFLSRVHPKKGIELLLQAWGKMDRRFDDWVLVIAGAGDPGYVEECRRAIADLGLEKRCFWAGQVDESQKSWLYRHAGCYVLPSYSENFGNTVAEALAHATPVITTPHTPWTNLPAEGCGWMAETTVESLRDVMTQALEMNPAERQRMGEIGQRLIEKQYSLASVVGQIDRVYAWTLGGPRPDDLLAP